MGQWALCQFYTKFCWTNMKLTDILWWINEAAVKYWPWLPSLKRYLIIPWICKLGSSVDYSDKESHSNLYFNNVQVPYRHGNQCSNKGKCTYDTGWNIYCNMSPLAWAWYISPLQYNPASSHWNLNFRLKNTQNAA